MKIAQTNIEDNGNKVNGMRDHLDSLSSLVSEMMAKHSVMENKLETMAESDL